MEPHSGRLFTVAFVVLSVAELMYFTAFGVAVFALPLYTTGPVGSDNAGAGLAFGAFAVTALVCRPFAGRLTDVLGRRPLLLFGALASGLGMMLMPVADTLALVLGLRLLQGAAETAFVVAGFALLADIAPPGRMGEALSYNSLGLYLGIAAGPVVGEVLLARGGFTAAWYGAATLTAMTVVSLFFLPAVPSPHGDAPVALIHRPAIPMSLGFFTALAAVSGFLAFASLHAEAIRLTPVSAVFALYGVVVVACRVVFATLPDRVPVAPLAAGSLAVIGLGLGVMALVPHPVGFLVGVVFVAVGVAFSTPAFFSAIFATALPSERGAASATTSAFMDVGLGFGPIALGFVADAAGVPWAFGAGAGVALAGAMWTLNLARGRAAPATRDSRSRGSGTSAPGR